MAAERASSLRRRLVFVAPVALLGGLLAVAGWSRAEPGQPAPSLTPACIQVWPEARYRNYGYDHIVHIGNACTVLAICAISSDVTPNPVRIEIKPGESLEVLIARGSTASQFTPRAECGLVL